MFPGVIGLSSFNQTIPPLQQLNLFLIYNHPGGFSARFTAWTAQHQGTLRLPRQFWQHHFFVGYRFPDGWRKSDWVC